MLMMTIHVGAAVTCAFFLPSRAAMSSLYGVVCNLILLAYYGAVRSSLSTPPCNECARLFTYGCTTMPLTPPNPHARMHVTCHRTAHRKFSPPHALAVVLDRKSPQGEVRVFHLLPHGPRQRHQRHLLVNLRPRHQRRLYSRAERNRCCTCRGPDRSLRCVWQVHGHG